MDVRYETTGFKDRVAKGKRWTVEVDATDPQGIKEVAILFKGPKGDTKFACGDKSAIASCTKTGDRYRFTAELAPGEQLARIRARDRLGHDWTHHKLVVVP